MAVSDYTAAKLFCMEETIAKELFSGVTYPYEVLPSIEERIASCDESSSDRTRRSSSPEIRFRLPENESAYIAGPCIIDEGAELRQCAFIRGKAIVGKGCVVGNSCELKNVVLFNKCEVPHYNYVGDSVLGFHAHMGAGSITSNIKSDRTNVVIHDGNEMLATGLRKMGAVLGDYVEVGCNSVLNPGTMIGAHTNVYPLSMVRGCVPAWHIYKDRDHVVEKLTDSGITD